MADAAHAELYAESRRDGNAADRAGVRRAASPFHEEIHDSCAPAAMDIFWRITLHITTSFKIDRLFFDLLKIKKTVLPDRALTLQTPVLMGSPRIFPYQTFPNSTDISCN
ncbi:hypothetical protein G3N57_27710 [Paraburkholderia sp. Se-20369]|nr:hypothetical protein [Paraburkholderia sp. Se-20369]